MGRLSKDAWYPTKAIMVGDRWIASRDSPVASRQTADLQIAAYQGALTDHARGRLLDLGCGNAPYAGIYAPLVETFDWADWTDSPHQTFVLDYDVDLNQPALPFASEVYDTILLTDVLEHIAEPDTVIRELRRILAPDGKIIIGVPFLYPIHEKPHDHFRYTRYQIQYLADKHQLSVVYLNEIGGVLDVIADLAAKSAGAINAALAALVYYTWRMVRRIGFIARANKHSAPNAPLAYMIVLQKRT